MLCRGISRFALLPVLFASMAFGCKSNKSETTAVHEQTPEQTVDKIMTSYDANKDASLDAGELDKCPSLKTLLKSMGKGPNGKISRDELLQRFTDIQAATIKMPSVPCTVTVDGAPLADATVTFALESFHGASGEATGKTNADGHCEVIGGGGILSGFYKISVSKQSGGTETIPSKYNTASTLGVEISNQGFGRGGTLELALSAR
jgi:hypothetical protein